jgi:hypothetical protein
MANTRRARASRAVHKDQAEQLTDNARVITKQKPGRTDKETKKVCTKSTQSGPVEACHDEGKRFRRTATR